MTPYFLLLNTLHIFRVDMIEEEVGLDISHCKGAAYDISGPSSEIVRKFEISRSHQKDDAGSSEEMNVSVGAITALTPQ